MQKNKTFLFLFLTLMLISFTSSTDLGTFVQNECVTLYQLCESCTYVNLTSVKQPNQTEIIGVNMNNLGFDFTYDYCSTSQVGNYQYNVCGDKGGSILCENIAFRITPSGVTPQTSDAIFYFINTFGSFFLFVLSLWIMIVIPAGNPKDESGEIIKITKSKYLKFMMVLVVYPLFLWLLNSLVGISTNFTTLSMFENYFGFILQSLTFLSFPIFVFVFVVVFFNLIRDMNLKETLVLEGRAI